PPSPGGCALFPQAVATRATEASTAPIFAARLRVFVCPAFAEAAVRVRVIVVDRMSCSPCVFGSRYLVVCWWWLWLSCQSRRCVSGLGPWGGGPVGTRWP